MHTLLCVRVHTGVGIGYDGSHKGESSTALGQQTRRTTDRRNFVFVQGTLSIIVSVEKRSCLERLHIRSRAQKCRLEKKLKTFVAES